MAVPFALMSPAPFLAIGADVTINQDAPAGLGRDTMVLRSSLYNPAPFDPTHVNNATQDLRARIDLGTTQATFTVFQCGNADCTATSTLAGPTALPTDPNHPLGVGTVHTLLTQSTPTQSTVTFQIDGGQPVTVGSDTLPAFGAPSYVPVTGIDAQAAVPFGLPGASASIDGTVSNVFVVPDPGPFGGI
jgi:hypothetical protein